MTMVDRISRRDFLRFSGLGLSTLAFGKTFQELNKASIEFEQENTFETDNAVFIPFFEAHSRRNSDQRILDAKPDCLFIEYTAPTVVVLNSQPLGLLTKESITPWGSGDIGMSAISQKLQIGLNELDTKVSIEGLDIPPDIIKQAEIVNKSTNNLSGLTMLASMGVALGRLSKNKELTKGDCTRIYSSILATLWANSNELAKQGLLNTYYTDKDSLEIRKAQDVANRICATVSFAHPEDVVVFMRNLFMTSKLITLAEYFDKGSEKPKIAFRMGAGHGAVSDLVKTGRSVCNTMLNVYPNNILRRVVEYNTSNEKTFEERVQDFCTTIVIPVREAQTYNTGTKYVVDNDLKTHLLNKFGFAESQKQLNCK